MTEMRLCVLYTSLFFFLPTCMISDVITNDTRSDQESENTSHLSVCIKSSFVSAERELFGCLIKIPRPSYDWFPRLTHILICWIKTNKQMGMMQHFWLRDSITNGEILRKQSSGENKQNGWPRLRMTACPEGLPFLICSPCSSQCEKPFMIFLHSLSPHSKFVFPTVPLFPHSIFLLEKTSDV